MERRKFVRLAGMSAFAITASGFTLIKENGILKTSCATSTDMLGPFFREGAPRIQDLTYPVSADVLPILVKGRVLGADCQTPLGNIDLDVWHCDHEEEYDMESDDFRCRAKLTTDSEGNYWFKTYIPPPYGGRPKHIHYLIQNIDGYEELVTQLYFKGDRKIKPNNWVKYPWDQKRILDINTNSNGIAEVKLDLYLSPKGKTTNHN